MQRISGETCEADFCAEFLNWLATATLYSLELPEINLRYHNDPTSPVLVRCFNTVRTHNSLRKLRFVIMQMPHNNILLQMLTILRQVGRCPNLRLLEIHEAHSTIKNYNKSTMPTGKHMKTLTGTVFSVLGNNPEMYIHLVINRELTLRDLSLMKHERLSVTINHSVIS